MTNNTRVKKVFDAMYEEQKREEALLFGTQGSSVWLDTPSRVSRKITNPGTAATYVVVNKF